MDRKAIINQIKKRCIDQYKQITDWVHDIHHIRRVVRNGKILAEKEGLSSLNSFLVEIACWLHDIGRVGEPTGLEFTKSNHAEISYQLSKIILEPFHKQIGREGIYKVLQAVREHNLPQLMHPENIIGKLLVDADRGSGLNPIGIYAMLSYLKVIQIEPVYNQKQAIQRFPQLLIQLQKENKLVLALEKIEFLNDWYWGTAKQRKTGAIVAPLYTKSAHLLYRNGLKQIQDFELELKKLIV